MKTAVLSIALILAQSCATYAAERDAWRGLALAYAQEICQTDLSARCPPINADDRWALLLTVPPPADPSEELRRDYWQESPREKEPCEWIPRGCH